MIDPAKAARWRDLGNCVYEKVDPTGPRIRVHDPSGTFLWTDEAQTAHFHQKLDEGNPVAIAINEAILRARDAG